MPKIQPKEQMGSEQADAKHPATTGPKGTADQIKVLFLFSLLKNLREQSYSSVKGRTSPSQPHVCVYSKNYINIQAS